MVWWTLKMWLLMAIWLKVLQWKWYFHTIAQLSSVLFLVHSSLVCPWLGTYYGISRKVCVCIILSTSYISMLFCVIVIFSLRQQERVDSFQMTQRHWLTVLRKPCLFPTKLFSRAKSIHPSNIYMLQIPRWLPPDAFILYVNGLPRGVLVLQDFRIIRLGW